MATLIKYFITWENFALKFACVHKPKFGEVEILKDNRCLALCPVTPVSGKVQFLFLIICCSSDQGIDLQRGPDRSIQLVSFSLLLGYCWMCVSIKQEMLICILVGLV